MFKLVAEGLHLQNPETAGLTVAGQEIEKCKEHPTQPQACCAESFDKLSDLALQPATFVPAGIKAASSSSKYVLCLDDDVTLHPTAVSMLVAAAEDDPEAFMVTGDPHYSSRSAFLRCVTDISITHSHLACTFCAA